MQRAWKTGLALAVPLLVWLLSHLCQLQSDIQFVLVTTALMAVLWITELIPLGITSLIPLAVYPVFGLADAADIAPLYANQIIFLFIAGFLLAYAMEKWGLHKRIALGIISKIGYEPKRVLMGFMAAAFFLSMWINNTATTVVLLSPALAIIHALYPEGKSGPLAYGLLLGICYASSIGGTATPIGTAPNLIMLNYYRELAPDSDLGFSSWMMTAGPVSLILLVITFLLLRFRYFKTEKNSTVPSLKGKIERLARFSYEEKIVAIIFILLAVLWLTRSPINIGSFHFGGWSSLPLIPEKSFIKDSGIGILLTMLFFFIPSRKEPGRTILDRKDAARLPFDILFIFGGGFAIAEGFKISGLSDALGVFLQPLAGFPMILLIMLLSLGMVFLTEISSNTATTQLILPIVLILIEQTGLPALPLLLPVTISASLAFMLPVATPPNAIVYASEKLPQKEMLRTGWWLNLISVLVITMYFFLFVD